MPSSFLAVSNIPNYPPENSHSWLEYSNVQWEIYIFNQGSYSFAMLVYQSVALVDLRTKNGGSKKVANFGVFQSSTLDTASQQNTGLSIPH